MASQECVGLVQEQIKEDVQEIVAHDVPKKSRCTTEAHCENWPPEQEVALAKAWIQISTCKKVGNAQSKDRFWKRVLEHFKTNVGTTTRTHQSLNTKWDTMIEAIDLFNGLYIQAKRIKDSGCSNVDVMKTAMSDYHTVTKFFFAHMGAWEIVRVHARWLEQPSIQDIVETLSLKRKSAEYKSGSNHNILPDRRVKKKPNATSSMTSIADTINTYRIRKTQWLNEQAEQRRENDRLEARLLAARLERAKFRDMKFFMDPHDHIADPVMLEFVLGRKRELAAKHGWPCNF